MSAGRVVVGGSTGFMGRFLLSRFRAEGREVVTISRSGADIRWGDQVEIDRAVDGAALVVGLAGKSVNCRYTPENRAEIFRSRLDTTASLSTAIARASTPPALWVNSSTATIYRHAEDRAMTESTGEIGTGFSVEVAKAWEKALFADDLLHATRRAAQRHRPRPRRCPRSGERPRPARARRIPVRRTMAGQRCASGRRHRPLPRRPSRPPALQLGAHRRRGPHHRVPRAVAFLEGPVNAASPHPVDNVEFMATVRRVLGARIGVPMPRWMLELGAIGMRTETELILKSRWVLPEKLTTAGFEFRYPTLEEAIRESFDREPAA